MNSNQLDAGVLALYPPKILLGTEDVISDPPPPTGVPVQGVPLGIFEEVAQRNGTLSRAVTVLVDAPVGSGDYSSISLWVNGMQSGVEQVVKDETMSFKLYQSELLDGQINKIIYKLKRPSGNETLSTELWALYSENLPGGNDVPSTGDHPNLSIHLPAELGDPPSIGKDEVEKGVLVALDYPYMKAYDVVTLEIGRERFSYTVNPAEAGQSFSALVDRDKFELVGSLDACPFSYTVIDQLKNATHKRRWSKRILADIDIDKMTLNKPILREDPDDDMDDPEIIDHDKLQGKPLLVVIIPQAPTFQKDDDVLVTYRSTRPEAELKLVGKITANFGVLQLCVVEVPNVGVVAGSQVQVTFELSRAGQMIGGSKPAIAKVIGDANLPDEKPTISRITGLLSGELIEPGGTTKETAVTIIGSASEGLDVELFEGANSKGRVTADSINGKWHCEVGGLSSDTHSFTAKALYGSGKVSEPPMVFTVVGVAPILSEDFESMPEQVVGIGESIETPSMTITASLGSPSRQAMSIEPSDPRIRPSFGTKCLLTASVTLITFEFKTIYSSVCFHCLSVGDGSFVDYYDSNGASIGSRSLPKSLIEDGHFRTYPLLFTGTKIKKMTIAPKSGAILQFDLFSFTI